MSHGHKSSTKVVQEQNATKNIYIKVIAEQTPNHHVSTSRKQSIDRSQTVL